MTWQLAIDTIRLESDHPNIGAIVLNTWAPIRVTDMRQAAPQTRNREVNGRDTPTIKQEFGVTDPAKAGYHGRST